MKNDKTIVQYSSLPFDRTFKTLELEKCKTIREIVNKTVPFNFQDCDLIVTLGDRIADESEWDKPLKKGEIVGLRFVPRGGSGGGKQILTMVVVAVLAVVTAGAAAAAYGAVAATSIGAASIGGISIAGALAYVGVVAIGAGLMTLAQNALMSTPEQSRSIPNQSEAAKNFVSSSSNEIRKYGVIPINLGVNRMYAYQAALPYVETSNNENYCRQMFTYGYGKVRIAERKFGETKIENFSEVQFEDKLDANLNEGVELYANDVYEESLNINLKKETGDILRTTQPDTNEAEIDVTFQGLIYMVGQEGGKYSGLRLPETVEFEVQFAPVGTENWSTGVNGLDVEAQSITSDISLGIWYWDTHPTYFINRDYYLFLNIWTGEISIQAQDAVDYIVSIPNKGKEWVCLGYFRNQNFVDLRSRLVGTHITSLEDFKVTYNASDPKQAVINVSSGKILGSITTQKVTASTSQTLRKTFKFRFPKAGQYDIRIKRLTADSTLDNRLNTSYLTAIRSISYQNPVRFKNISGSALKVRATDQLNGTIDSYNCIVTTLLKGYNPETSAWEDDVVSSNPADIFRYVLQSPAFAKALPDDRIDIEKLEEWWVYCNENKLTFNRIIDYDTSIDDVINDICAAGFATPSKVNNIYSVIIDNERPIVKGLVTPRNSWDYQGSINYPELPHAFRVEFRNAEYGYETDERIVYRDGYNANNAELFERLQFPSCTNADLAYLYGRRYLASALLQYETHTFKMDFENMTFNRGDRITLVNDVVLVGVGQGRIKELLVDDVDNPTKLMGFTIDDMLDIPPVEKLGVRVRDNKGKSEPKYHLLQNVEGRVDTFTFAEPIDYSEAPEVGSLCAFVEDGKELDLLITQIQPEKDLSATITAVDYAPARFEPLGEIPPFESNITIPIDFYKPKAPVLMSEVKSDESVMVRNSDGSLISVMVIDLINYNESDILPLVKCRLVGTTEWFNPTSIKKEASQLVLTGLDDGSNYDIEIRYQRQTGLQLASDPLLLENIKFIGGSTPPKKVQNFRVTVTNGLALFEWTPNDDIDISHYVIRFSASLEDVTWEGSQIAMDRITSTAITNIIHKGVYLIKAYDMLGNESEEASIIVSTETGAFKNVVEELIEDPEWLGRKENLTTYNGLLYIDDDELVEGYYYFERDEIDLSEVYECSLSANVKAVIEKKERVRDIDFIREVEVGIRNYGAGDITSSDWGVELQMDISLDGQTWSGWQTFVASQMKLRAARFRLRIWSASVYTTPRVSICRVTIDMPDRYESAEDVIITDPAVGAVIEYENPFWNNPAVNITVQDGAVDDRLEFTVKNNKGFTFKVYNGTLGTYVARSFDYLAAGYGKVISQ